MLGNVRLKTAMALMMCTGLATGACLITRAWASEPFPFDRELTMNARPMSGSKRLPTLEIAADGAAKVGLWCYDGKGQFIVVGDAVSFIPGEVMPASCSDEQKQRDNALLNEMMQVTAWKMTGEVLTLIGPRNLEYCINTN